MRSEPVLIAGGIASAIVVLVSAFLAMSVSLGWCELTPAQIDSVNGFTIALVAAVAIAAPLIMAWFARKKVTPLANPKDVDGEPLTRSDNSPALKARQ